MSKDNQDKLPEPSPDPSAAEIEAQQHDLNKAIDEANAQRAIDPTQAQSAEPENSPQNPEPDSDASAEKVTAHTPYDATGFATLGHKGEIKVVASMDKPAPKAGVRNLSKPVPSGAARQDTQQSSIFPPPPPPRPSPKPSSAKQDITPPPPSDPGLPIVVKIGKIGPWAGTANQSPPPPPPPGPTPKPSASKPNIPPPPPPAQKSSPSAPNVSASPPQPSRATTGLTPHDPGGSRLSGKGLRPWEKGSAVAPTPPPSQGAPNAASAPASSGSLSPIGRLARDPQSPPPPLTSSSIAPSQPVATPGHNPTAPPQAPASGLPNTQTQTRINEVELSDFDEPVPGDTNTPPTDTELEKAAKYIFQGDQGKELFDLYKNTYEEFVDKATRHERSLGLSSAAGGFLRKIRTGAPTQKEVIVAGNDYDDIRQVVGYKLAQVFKTLGYSDKQAQAAVKTHDAFQIELTGAAMRDRAESRANVEYSDPSQKQGLFAKARAKYYNHYIKGGKIKKAAMLGAIGVPAGIAAATLAAPIGAAGAAAAVIGASRFAKGLLGAKVSTEANAVTLAEDRRKYRVDRELAKLDNDYTIRSAPRLAGGHLHGADLYQPIESITGFFSEGVINAANKNRKRTMFKLGAVGVFGALAYGATEVLSGEDLAGSNRGSSEADSGSLTGLKNDITKALDNATNKFEEMTAAAEAKAAAGPEASAQNNFGENPRHFERTKNGSLFGLAGAEADANRLQLHHLDQDGKISLRDANGDMIASNLELNPDGGLAEDSVRELESKGIKVEYIEPGDSKSPNGRWDIVDERTDAQRGIVQDTSLDSDAQPSGTATPPEAGDLIGEAGESGGAAAPDESSGLIGSVRDELNGGSSSNTDTPIGRGSGLSWKSSFARPAAGGVTGTINGPSPQEIAHEEYLKKVREQAEAGDLTGTVEDE